MKTITHNKKPVILFLILTMMGIFLPGLLLHLIFSSDLNTIRQTSKSQYNTADSVIAQNVSSKLSDYEKMKLISGTWDSEQIEADASRSAITELEAVEAARKAISRLYQKKCYPYHFDSAYGNWYSWETHFYQCTETAFHTYSACYWQISFLRYDSEERHDVLLTEAGTLLAVRNNRSSETASQLPKHWSRRLQSYFQKLYAPEHTVNSSPRLDDSGNTVSSFQRLDGSGNTIRSSQQKAGPKTLAAYPNIRFSPTDILADNVLVLNHSGITSEQELEAMLPSLPEKTEIYEICSYTNPHYFLLAVIPWK